jgi:hypothetical protein
MDIKTIGRKFRTNENNITVKAAIAGVITVAVIGAGIYFTKKGAPTPVVIVVEEAAEAVSDAVKS